MNYVFFDVECANCLNGEGKICSFGYVKTDENFNVLKKKDILIDPVAPFLLGNAKTGDGIKLAYPLFRFQRAYTFPHYYKEIKKLLEDPSNLCFGFAVFQDVSYISYTCRRYSLPIIEFKFFDIQKMEKEINHRKNNSGLDHLVEEYHLDTFTYHRSDDDALMSMEVLKALLEKNQLKVEDLLSRFPNSFDRTDNLLKELERRKKVKAAKKAHNEKVRKLFMEPHAKVDINLYNPLLFKKTFLLDNELLNKQIDYFFQHKEIIEKHGIILTRNPALAEVVIIERKNKKINLPNLNTDAKYIDFASFKIELNRKGN